MRSASETLRSWDNAAGRYEERFMRLSIYDESYEALLAELPAGARVLELGCGPGMITAYLLRARPDLRCTVTDAAPAMLALASANCPGAAAVLLDARDLAALPGSFDVVVAGFVLPYLSEAEAGRLMKDAAARLERDGLLYLSFVPGSAADSRWQTGSTGDRMYFHYHPEEQVKEWLRAAGFALRQELAVQYEAQEHRILICATFLVS